MPKFALVSPLALAFGLALSGAATAQVVVTEPGQVMVGDQVVFEEDMVDVQAHCDALATAASTAPSPAEATVEVDEAANARTAVELTTITIQQCIDAGFIDGPIPGLTPSATSTGTDDEDTEDDDTTDDDTSDDDTDDTTDDTTTD
jgi:hypothetical protein